MKKILCLIDGLGYGGAQRQIIGLTSFLKRKGYNVDLACYHDKIFYEDLLSRFEVEPTKLNCENSKYTKYKAVKNLILKEKYDIVISYLSSPSIISCIIKFFFRNKFKLIVSERNSIPKQGLKGCLRYWLYKYSDYIVPNSYTQSEYIANNFPSLANKIITITNYTDTEFFSPSKHEEINTNEKLKILVVGSIHPQKNVHTFIEAMNILHKRGIKFHVKWFGNVKEKTLDYYKNQCFIREKYGLQNDIEFLKETSDIRSEYRQCNIFCLPSKYEGFPNVLCEAMSCGKPVLASNICDNPRIVDDEINGYLFNPDSPEQLCEKIEKFIGLKKEEKRKMGLESRRLAIERFSTESFVKKYIDIIEQ